MMLYSMMRRHRAFWSTWCSQNWPRTIKTCKTYKSGLGAFRQNRAFCLNACHFRLRSTLLTAARASAALFMFDFHILERSVVKVPNNTAIPRLFKTSWPKLIEFSVENDETINLFLIEHLPSSLSVKVNARAVSQWGIFGLTSECINRLGRNLWISRIFFTPALKIIFFSMRISVNRLSRWNTFRGKRGKWKMEETFEDLEDELLSG